MPEWLFKILIEVSGLVMIGIGGFFAMRTSVAILTMKVDKLETAVTKILEVLNRVAVQDNRLDRLESDVRELRHGEGMVLPLADALGRAPPR